MLDRIDNNLLIPLSQMATGSQVSSFTDKNKLAAAFKELQSYCNLLGLMVRAFHIIPSSNLFAVPGHSLPDSTSLEKLIKSIMSMALKLSQVLVDDATQKARNVWNSSESQTSNNLALCVQ